MKIVIAADSFKGSLQTLEAAEHIKRGILRVLSEARITVLPIADGGEGTVNTMVAGLKGRMEWYTVADPMGNPMKAPVGYLDPDTAVIEIAAASGLSLVKPSEDSVKRASTYGTGQLLLHALDVGCRTVYVGMGGSGTNDAGIGFAQALGYRFYDEAGELIPEGRASLLDSIGRIDCGLVDPRLKETSVIAISDVDNPLLGEKGAAHIFGRQKGMTDSLIPVFDRAMRRFAQVLRKEFGREFEDIPGAGAGGGFGAGLMAFADARIERGIDTVLDAVKFDDAIADADLVITGEGRIDHQSVHGKVPVGVAQRAKKQNKMVAAVVGSVGKDYEKAYQYGLDAIESAVAYPITLEEAMEEAGDLVEDAAERLIRAIAAGRRMNHVNIQRGNYDEEKMDGGSVRAGYDPVRLLREQ